MHDIYTDDSYHRVCFPTVYYDPSHGKTNKMKCAPAKTRISLGIHAVRSESSLCAQWVAKDPSFLHADSKDTLTLNAGVLPPGSYKTSIRYDLNVNIRKTSPVRCLMIKDI